MGIDYLIYNIDKKKRYSPHDYGQGGRIVEHCSSGGSYLYELLILLMDEWKGNRFFNISDYEIDGYPEYSDVPDEYMDRGGYTDHEKKVLTYHKRSYGSELKTHWFEKLPAMWQEVSEKYVLVNYDKALYCQIDCIRDVPFKQKYCTLPFVLMGGTKIPHDKHEYVSNWRFNHIGLERKDSSFIDWMEDISHVFK